MKKVKMYWVLVKKSPMNIVGTPMWPGTYYKTEAEAEEAAERARREIEETWASPMLNKMGRTMVPVWVEPTLVTEKEMK